MKIRRKWQYDETTVRQNVRIPTEFLKYISKVASASETIAVYLSFSALYNNVLE